MMVTTDEGARLFVQLMVHQAQGEDLVLFLYSNRVIPATSVVLGDLVELAGGGYQGRVLPGANWTVDKKGAKTLATYKDPQVWTFTSLPATAAGRLTADVWGYGIRMGQILIGLELLEEPVAGADPKPFEIAVVGEDGDRITVAPSYYQVVD